MARRKKNIDIEELWKVERVGGVSLSSDGAQAVCALTRHSMQDNSSAASLWLLSTLGGESRRLTACGDKDGQPQWSPTGDRIAFIARREQEGKKDAAAQLYAIAPDGGEAVRVSDYAPGVEAFKWFPDGRRIAFVAWVWPDTRGAKAQARRHAQFKDRKESAYVTSEAHYRHWDRHLPMDRVPHLLVLDVASGQVRDLFEGTPLELPRADPGVSHFDIAPDGRSIVFVHDPRRDKRPENCKALSEIRLKDRRVNTVVHDAGWDFSAPRFSSDGRQLAFTASHQARRHTMPAQLALLDLLNRQAGWQVLSADWDHDVNAPLRWAADGSALYFTAEDRARCHLYRFDITTKQAAIAVAGGWVQGFDVAGDTVLSAADAMDHPVRVHAHRGGESQRIECFNDALLAQLRLSRHEEVVYPGAQGEDVQMWLVFPPGFDAKKRYPLLHCIHGGPHAASGDTWHYRWNNQVFAAQGYVLACVNYHGSSGFGHAFLDSNTQRWGELELQDIETATDLLLKKPYIHRRRVFASGGSYGGFMVAWMNAHVADGRYQAYVCHAGCFDWTAMFADDVCGWHAKDLGAFYWDDMARVQAQSPHASAGQMHTPTLVVHGALDYRVPDQQGLAYYNTLKMRGVPARLVWFPDENHWVLKPRNSRLWYGEFFDWLNRHTPAAR
jgi:dipeptidyl aminopeptidase/acylaminoacyl peptidase